jgi:hypothetical protein
MLMLMEPGVLAQFLLSGEIGGEKIGSELLLIFAIILLAPLVMAFSSLTLKDSTDRWANIIVGMVYVVFQIIALGEAVAQPSAWLILMEVSKLVAPALVVWYAWRSRQKS